LKSLVPANVISRFKTSDVYLFDPKDHDPCDQMVTLQTSGVDSTTASTLVQRDAENGDSVAQVAVAFTKEETLFAR